MACTADALSTTVYALIDQQSYCNLTTQSTDVLGRRERHSTEASRAERYLPTVRLYVNGKQIEFTYDGPNSAMPTWATPILQSLSERWGAFDGWDSYEAKPTNPQLVVSLLNILSGFMEDSSITPSTTPLADGGIQAEWHRHGRDLEIVVRAHEYPKYYYFDSATNEEEEGDLDSNFAQVRDLIGRFRKH